MERLHWINNFAADDLGTYRTMVQCVDEDNLVIRENFISLTGPPAIDRTPNAQDIVHHSLWYYGCSKTDAPERMWDVMSALHIKRYAPKKAVFRVTNGLGPCLLCSVAKNSGEVLNPARHAEDEIVMNFPVEWMTMVQRLAEVMNEPGDGQAAFVLIEDDGYYNLCREYGQETVARFPGTGTGIDRRMALRCLDYLNRRNDYIAAGRPKKKLKVQIARAFRQLWRRYRVSAFPANLLLVPKLVDKIQVELSSETFGKMEKIVYPQRQRMASVRHLDE